MTRQVMRVLAGVAVVVSTLGAARADANAVTILSAEPVGLVEIGRLAEFVVEVEVELTSARSGAVQIAFNDRGPDSFRTVHQERARAGTHRMTFRGLKAVAADWGGAAEFSVRVNVGPWTARRMWRPYAEDTFAVPLVPSSEH